MSGQHRNHPIGRGTIVLIGAHGAGKSALGAALSARLGWTFHEEIGRWLAQRLRPDGADAEAAQRSFDHAVMAAELARDRGWPPGLPRIIESWHPVNLAYAALRSPGAADPFAADLRAAIEAIRAAGPVWVLPLRRTHRPHTEPGDPAFFARVGAEAERAALRLHLPTLPPLSNDGPLAQTADEAIRHITKRISCPEPT